MRTLSPQHFDDVVDPQKQQSEIADQEGRPHQRGAHGDLRYQLPNVFIVEIRHFFSDPFPNCDGKRPNSLKKMNSGPFFGGANDALMR